MIVAQISLDDTQVSKHPYEPHLYCFLPPPQYYNTSSITTHLTKMAECEPPRRYGVLLFPAFQALDVFGPLDALNLLSFTTQLNLSIIARTLDPVTTKPQSPAMLAIGSNFGQSVLPTHTFDNAPEDIEVLIVPGGVGTRSPDLSPEINFIKQRYPKLKHLLSVCTGAGLLARAGVLDGKRATTNKKAWAETTALGPNVNWVTHARWVEDGNLWTSSGVSAGIDMMVAFIGAKYPKIEGEDRGDVVARAMEYIRNKEGDDPFADYYGL